MWSWKLGNTATTTEEEELGQTSTTVNSSTTNEHLQPNAPSDAALLETGSQPS